MGKEFPVAEGTPFAGVQTSGHLDLRQDRSRAPRFFGHLHYKAIGPTTGTLDYLLIVMASILAGVTYHSVILQGDVPESDAVCGRGKYGRRAFCSWRRVARKLQPGHYCLSASPNKIRHHILVSGSSEPGLVSLLGQIRSRFFTRNHHIFRVAGIRPVARVPSLDFCRS